MAPSAKPTKMATTASPRTEEATFHVGIAVSVAFVVAGTPRFQIPGFPEGFMSTDVSDMVVPFILVSLFARLWNALLSDNAWTFSRILPFVWLSTLLAWGFGAHAAANSIESFRGMSVDDTLTALVFAIHEYFSHNAQQIAQGAFYLLAVSIEMAAVNPPRPTATTSSNPLRSAAMTVLPILQGVLGGVQSFATRVVPVTTGCFLILLFLRYKATKIGFLMQYLLKVCVYL